MANIVDSYSESNYDVHVSSTTYPYWGQSFACSSDFPIDSVKFYLSKNGSPTGSAYVTIYPHTGTYGTSSYPTGGVAIHSDPFDV